MMPDVDQIMERIATLRFLQDQVGRGVVGVSDADITSAVRAVDQLVARWLMQQRYAPTAKAQREGR